MMKKFSLLFVVALLVLSSLACGLFTGGAKAPNSAPTGDSATSSSPDTPKTEEAAPAPSSNSGKYDTEFPLPDDVSNFIDMGDAGINFQTKMSLEDGLKFYQDALSAEGYQERELLTVTSATTFNLVFDGHPSGKAIVVQGVDLGDGNLNINVRLEDV
jgi:hypothetical protein